jgi:hypothetical protein
MLQGIAIKRKYHIFVLFLYALYKQRDSAATGFFHMAVCDCRYGDALYVDADVCHSLRIWISNSDAGWMRKWIIYRCGSLRHLGVW